LTPARALPWPRGGSALGVQCETLYAEPADPRGPEAWGQEPGMSEQTLGRRIEAEVGMSLRSWRLRLFKAI
jgi:AraC-like DNA-binding protein